MFQTNVVEKIKSGIYVEKIFPPKNRAIYEIMCNKYDRAGQATDDNIILRTRFVCWINRATNTHSGYVILIASHGNHSYGNAHQSNFTHSYSILFSHNTSIYSQQYMVLATCFGFIKPSSGRYEGTLNVWIHCGIPYCCAQKCSIVLR
jgi:hypothetical protein